MNGSGHGRYEWKVRDMAYFLIWGVGTMTYW